MSGMSISSYRAIHLPQVNDSVATGTHANPHRRPLREGGLTWGSSPFHYSFFDLQMT